MSFLKDLGAGWLEVFIIVLALSAVFGVGKYAIKRWRQSRSQ